MLTRSQTAAAKNFFEQVEESVSRKTRAIRRDSYASFVTCAPVKREKKVPQNLFTIIRTRSQTRNMVLSQPSNFVRSIDSHKDQQLNKPVNDRKILGELEVNIDFDDASREWRKNKRRMGNGTYSYK